MSVHHDSFSDGEFDGSGEIPPVKLINESGYKRLRRGFGYIAGLAATAGGGYWTYNLLGNAETVRALMLTTGGVSELALHWINRPVNRQRKEVGNNIRTAKRFAAGVFVLSGVVFSMTYNNEKDTDSKKVTDDTEQSAGGTDSTTPGVNSELDCPIDFTQIGLAEEQGDPGAISVLQLELRDLGYYVKRIDGEEGPLTRGALDAFEVKNGLDPVQPFSEATCDLLFSPEAIRADA